LQFFGTEPICGADLTEIGTWCLVRLCEQAKWSQEFSQKITKLTGFRKKLLWNPYLEQIWRKSVLEYLVLGLPLQAGKVVARIFSKNH
jgi:hypothetical protein